MFSEGSDGAWFIFNASPDIGLQLRHPALWSTTSGEIRRQPFEAVLLTDAELDSTIGLLSLRQAEHVCVYATTWVYRALSESGLILETLRRYCEVEWRRVELGATFALQRSDRTPVDLAVTAFATGNGKLPAYCRDLEWSEEAVVGYRLTDLQSGRSCVYAPTIGRSASCGEWIVRCDYVLLDGTVWSDDELLEFDKGKSALDLGHTPISGPGGTLDQRPPGVRWVYTHINNTNPVLVDGPTRRQVFDSGAEIAFDGMEIEV